MKLRRRGSEQIEYTLKTNCFGTPILYVRGKIPGSGYGDWEWEKWRKPKPEEQDLVLMKIIELNKEINEYI